MDTILDKWKSRKLRDLNYINFTFDDPDLLDYDEEMSNTDEVQNNYYTFCVNNVIKILNILQVKDSTEIIIYSNTSELKDYLTQNSFVESDSYCKGNCDYKNLIDIIKLTITPFDFKKKYPDTFLPIWKDDEMMDLYHFPQLKLLLYIYDQRGGILVSEDENKEKLKSIFDTINLENKSLLNDYWYSDMYKLYS